MNAGGMRASTTKIGIRTADEDYGERRAAIKRVRVDQSVVARWCGSDNNSCGCLGRGLRYVNPSSLEEIT
jgi:hypothetical protein